MSCQPDCCHLQTLVMPLLRKELSWDLQAQREKSMVRKAQRSVSQWDSGMPMVPLKPRESGDVWMVFLCASVRVGYASVFLRLVGACFPSVQFVQV